MGGRRSLWGVSVAALMLTVILCSSDCCRGSSLSRTNATYGEVELELFVHREIARFLNPEGYEGRTDNTANRNIKACNSPEGKAMGACDRSATDSNRCTTYDRGCVLSS